MLALNAEVHKQNVEFDSIKNQISGSFVLFFRGIGGHGRGVIRCATHLFSANRLAFGKLYIQLLRGEHVIEVVTRQIEANQVGSSSDSSTALCIRKQSSFPEKIAPLKSAKLTYSSTASWWCIWDAELRPEKPGEQIKVSTRKVKNREAG